MAKISRQEILAIARISNLEVHADEIDALIEQIEQVLNYAERVKEVTDTQESNIKNSNIFREDIVHTYDPEIILKRAPEREGDYFVVPLILESPTENKKSSIGGEL